MAELSAQKTQKSKGPIDNRPLYVQVREILLDRISSGTWRPGDLIPNEFAIAEELGVSQGTIRKALDSLAADHLLVRRQGRGTYVARHTSADMLFRFFNFFDANGERVEPNSCNVRRSEGTATKQERARLALEEGETVFRISRVRTRKGEPFISETIVLPQRLFKSLADTPHLPNTLYDHFQKVHDITIARATDRLTVAAAGAREAKALGIEKGTPLLRLDRTAYGLRGEPVEWRLSLCRMDDTAYVVELG